MRKYIQHSYQKLSRKETMRRYIKHLYLDTTIGRLIISPIREVYFYLRRFIPEEIFIRRTFKSRFGYDLNLDNPETLNEKIHWLQKNGRSPLHTLCADKYAVREYVKEKIGEQYLIPLELRTTNPKDLVPENLPEYPLIIKTNHGCGGHVIVRNKYKIKWKSVHRNLTKLLKSNYYYRSKEWQYKDIKPCIVVEKLLLDENSNIPSDYNFHCCNGKVKFIAIAIHGNIHTKVNYYDPDWYSLMMKWGISARSNDIKKPEKLNKLKSLAESLAKDFSYVRVDLYYCDSKIYFGELTFSPRAGFLPFNPSEWDRIFGDQLKL